MASNEIFSRNYGYVDEEIQNNLAELKILVAGCGLGSYIVESLVRLGCLNFILVDHDTVDIHNLNRQNFIFKNLGQFKSVCLKERMLLINPEINIQALTVPVSESNAKNLVSQADIIIDTIDFLSVKALVSLYEECSLQKKTVISALNAGWGAVAFYIPQSNQTKNWFKEIFNISDIDNANPNEYAYYFKQLIYRIKPYLPEEVSKNLIHVFDLMAENKPCPASQLSAGSFAAASLCTTILYRHLSNKTIVELPYAMALDMNAIANNPAFPLGN